VLKLPDLPPHVQMVADEDNDRLITSFSLPRRLDQCPTCHGAKQFLFYDDMRKPIDEREVVDWECACYEQIVLQRYFLNHGIGSAYAQLWWADAEGVDSASQAAGAAYAKDLVRNVDSGIGLYLHGTHGNGKSMLASLLRSPDYSATDIVRTIRGITASQAALLPLAYYTGRDFKPAKRIPARNQTHWNAWGRR